MSFLYVQTNKVNSYRWLVAEKLRGKLLKAKINRWLITKKLRGKLLKA